MKPAALAGTLQSCDPEARPLAGRGLPSARRLLSSSWADDYQAAVTAALTNLQRYTTIAESVAAYFDLDGDGWLNAHCRPPSGHVINLGDVEDAAYWRRAQQLIAAAAGDSGERTD